MSWDKILTGLWEASLSGSVILLTALVLRTLFQNRTPRRIFCLLWDIALVRLLLPCALSSPVSIWRWFPVSAEAPGQGLWPELTSGTAPGQSLWPELTSGAAPVGATAIGDAVFRKNTVARIALSLDVDVMLAAVWLTAALVLAAWFFMTHWRSRRLYADSLPCEDSFVRDWKKTHSLYRHIQVRSSDRVSAPLTYGALRPVILLPAGTNWQDRAAVSFVLEHEYQHILRFDTLRKGFLAAAACLHWLNPLVWVMYVLCNRDMELACDEAVIARSADRAGYARTLLDLEEQRGRLGLSGSHFSQSALEERIKSIMKQKHISIAAMIAVVTVMSISVVAFASAAPDNEGGARPGKNEPENGYVYDHFQAVEGDVMILSQGGEEGEKQYSVDGGRTWLSEEDYHAWYGGSDWQVEWWTAGDYALWLEEEKQALQSIIGERGYTGGEGWFTWDQKRVDETIALYESILENMKNGALYSRTITDKNGSVVEEVALGSGTLAEAKSYTYYELTDATALNAAEEPGSVQEFREVLTYTGGSVPSGTTGAALEPYKVFGLDYKLEWNQHGELQSYLRWNGKPVRSLYDTQTGAYFTVNIYDAELYDSAVDLTTIYREGQLCGLQESQPPHDIIHAGENT